DLRRQGQSDHPIAYHAGQDVLVQRMSDQVAPADDEEAGARSFTDDSLPHEKGLMSSGTLRLLFRQRVGQEVHRLDVALLPSQVRRGDDMNSTFFLGRVGKNEMA